MRLNHLDLQVSDVQKTVAFFTTIFGLELQSNPRSPEIAILGDGEGFVLVLQRRDPVVYPEGFHLGFLVDDVAIVHALHTRARAAGLEISDIDTNNRGTMTHCRAPDGYVVEVACHRPR